MIIIFCVILWLVCAVLCTAAYLADTYNEYPTLFNYRRDLARGLSLGLIFGPIALVVMFFSTGFFEHGLLFWKKK